jgi:hypothetical protein
MAETTVDISARQLDDLQRARRTVRMMAQGTMPAYDIAKRAAQALQDVVGSDQEQRDTLRTSTRVIAFIKMGVAPAQQFCIEADRQLEKLINDLTQRQVQGDDVAEEQEDAPRPNRMRGG